MQRRDVASLARVGGEIVELGRDVRRLGRDDVLPARRAPADAAIARRPAHTAECLDERLETEIGAGDGGQQARAVDPGRRADAGEREERRREIDLPDELRDGRARRQPARRRDDQRHADQDLVDVALVALAFARP